jgi:Uma2 family endonuclease
MAVHAQQPTSHPTPQEYLSLERSAPFKSEFLHGQLVAMAGASRQHNLLSGNVLTAFNVQFADRECEAYASDMRVLVSATNDFTYPDVVAVCGEPEFIDTDLDTLTNPTVLVEVLSPSTQNLDRQSKFALYRRIDSLQDHIVIAQAEVRVEHYVRQGAFQWLLTEYSHLEDSLTLPSIGCTLALADIYKKVEFTEQPSQTGADPRHPSAP